jgi:hypothetical protein
MKKISLLFLTLFSLSSWAQESAPKAPSRGNMLEGLPMMVGNAIRQMEQEKLMKGVRLLENPETASAVAKFKRNLYTELQAQGFSKTEALEITKATQAPAIQLEMKTEAPPPVPPATPQNKPNS